MEFILKPFFNAARNQIMFPTGSLNAFQAAQYNDKFGIYQSLFMVFSYMRLTRDLKFRIHYPTGTPFVWQTHNSCAWTPLGNLTMNVMEIDPCKAKVNEEMCYDEHFESAYVSMLEWGRSPGVQMNEQGVAAVNALTESIVKNATLGARLTMTVGSLYNLTTIDTEEDTPTRIAQAFEKTLGTCQGWIELLISLGTVPGNEHLDDDDLIDAADISADGKDYTGDALELYDANYALAKPKLCNAIAEGGVGGFGFQFNPLWLVSPSIFKAVRNKYIELGAALSTNDKRIELVEYPAGEGRSPLKVYVIDGSVVVIPIHEPSQVEQYLVGTSHFCYLTLSGVIQMGGSFNSIPTVGSSEVAVITQLGQDVEDYGKFKFLSHNLMATAVNDTDYVAGAYQWATPSP